MVRRGRRLISAQPVATPRLPQEGSMFKALRTIVRDYEWIHISLGIIGNVAFFVGSILFLRQFNAWQETGVWLFIVGSFLMLIGGIGQALVRYHERVEQH